MAQRPNILWVSFEDCYPYFGCYGDKVARTPHLDRLAAEGALWTRALARRSSRPARNSSYRSRICAASMADAISSAPGTKPAPQYAHAPTNWP